MATREHIHHRDQSHTGPTMFHATVVAAIALGLGFLAMPAATALMAVLARSGN